MRNMEPAWEKVNGCKFALVEYRDKKGAIPGGVAPLCVGVRT